MKFNIYQFTTTNRIYYLVAGIMVIIVFMTVIWILVGVGGGGGSTSSQELQFWGVFDDTQSFYSAANAFQRENPGTKITYVQLPFEEYEKRLVDAMAAGTGPDIFMIHHSWLPKHVDKVIPMPQTEIPETGRPLMTVTEFNSQFVEVAAEDLIFSNKIYGMPLYVDSLALYYNRDLFNSAGISVPPKTWEEFNDAVEKLTKLDSKGNISKPGAAMGTAKNINRSTDILMALMIQSGVPMTDSDNSTAILSASLKGADVGAVALQYYTDFANPKKRTYTWNNSQNYSIDSFVQGDLGMMLNYSHQASIIRAKNPRLNFAISQMPQISTSDIKNYGNYWSLAVSNKSKDPLASWKFLVKATSKEESLKYLSETGRPTARRDLVDMQKDDKDLGVFAIQSLSAKSWFQADNVAIEKIFSETIEDVNFNRASLNDALRSAESKINILMRNKKIK